MEFMLQILMSAEGFYSTQRCSCLLLSLFWINHNNNEHLHNKHLNNHAIHTTTPPSTHSTPPSSPLLTLRTPSYIHRAATISAGRVKEVG